MSSQKHVKPQVAKKASEKKISWLNTISADDTDEISIHSSEEDSVMIAEEEIEEYVRAGIQEWLKVHGASLFCYETSKFLKQQQKETDSKKKK